MFWVYFWFSVLYQSKRNTRRSVEFETVGKQHNETRWKKEKEERPQLQARKRNWYRSAITFWHRLRREKKSSTTISCSRNKYSTTPKVTQQDEFSHHAAKRCDNLRFPAAVVTLVFVAEVLGKLLIVRMHREWNCRIRSNHLMLVSVNRPKTSRQLNCEVQ